MKSTTTLPYMTAAPGYTGTPKPTPRRYPYPQPDVAVMRRKPKRT